MMSEVDQLHSSLTTRIVHQEKVCGIGLMWFFALLCLVVLLCKDMVLID